MRPPPPPPLRRPPSTSWHAPPRAPCTSSCEEVCAAYLTLPIRVCFSVWCTVCDCVCVCVYLRFLHLFVCLHERVYVCFFKCTYVYGYLYPCIYMYMCVYPSFVHTNTHSCKYVYINIYVCPYLYTCSHLAMLLLSRVLRVCVLCVCDTVVCWVLQTLGCQWRRVAVPSTRPFEGPSVYWQNHPTLAATITPRAETQVSTHECCFDFTVQCFPCTIVVVVVVNLFCPPSCSFACPLVPRCICVCM